MIENLLARNAARWALDGPFDPRREVELCSALGIRIIVKDTEDYPQLLSVTADAPEVLYVRGSLAAAGRGLALVGSRRPTPYGLRMARRLAADCARAGLTVVSGLARGIDTEAHRAALEAGGVTWAVLGSGLGRVYPPENAALSEAIVSAGGALISEVPLSGPPAAENFPRRNRIVAGLTWGTVVVEGDKRSGALITARLAAEQGREVFAVPGPADSALSDGPNELIRSGAGVALRLEDVLAQLPPGAAAAAPYCAPSGSMLERMCGVAAAPTPLLTLEQEKILELLGSDARSLEELIRESAWDLSRLIGALSDLEHKGAISSLPGQRYARI